MALTSKLSAIGDAIREKAGTTDKLTLDAMPDAIANIPSGGGGGDIDALVDRSITEYSSDAVSKVGDGAFENCTSLTSVDLSACSSVGNAAFNGCSKLTNVNLPTCTSVGNTAFQNCSKLTNVALPACKSVGNDTFNNCLKLTSVDLSACTSLGNYAFENCTNLTSVDLPMMESFGTNGYQFRQCYELKTVDLGAITSDIYNNCFYYNYSLTAVIIRTTSKVIKLSSANIFTSCYHFYGTVNSTYNPNGLKDGYIYVPDTLVDSYKTATYWKTLASQIKPLSEYTG